MAVPGASSNSKAPTSMPSLDPHSMASKPVDSTIPSAPTLSLPNGGSSIQGMGEKFKVNLSNGTATTSLPIRVSACRKLQPNLTLSYSSGSSNGTFGIGWQLSLPRISRKTDKGIPRYQDSGPDSERDVFIISDMEDLVPVFKRDSNQKVILGSDRNPVLEETTIDGFTVTRYAPRIQQNFDRLEMWTSISDRNDTHWRQKTPQNLTTIFGGTESSRIQDPNLKAGEASRVFAWLVSEMYDPHGNSIIFNYKAEDSSNVSLGQANESNRSDVTRSANRYIKSIKYGNIVPNRDLSNWKPISAFKLKDEDWKFSVVFDYGEHDINIPTTSEVKKWICRQDPFSGYHSSFELRNYRLCRRILVFHHFQELGKADYLVSSTDFTYAENFTAAYLTAAVYSGYTVDSSGLGYFKKSLPPVTYEYSQFPDDNDLLKLPVQEVDKASSVNFPYGIDGSYYQFVDLNREGLAGVITEQAGALFYAANESAANTRDDSAAPHAKFASMQILDSKPSMPSNNGDVHFGDASGAGNTDLITTNPSTWGFYERTQEGGWAGFQTFASYPNVDLNEKQFKFVDMDGDGLADILSIIDQTYVWYPSLGALGYGPGRTVVQSSSQSPIPVYGDSEQTIYLASMSGGGLQDIVRIRNGDVSYWPNCGYGKFAPLVIMDNAPTFDADCNFDHGRIRMSDVDGSGTTDILYLSDDGIKMYLNQAGNGFSTVKTLTSFPQIDNISSVSVLDLLGNGTGCVVWSSSAPGAFPAPLRYVDLMQGQKPHLLTKVINNLGTESQIQYAPSTQFYLQDREKGTHWITTVPFPVHCVEKTEVIDRISGNRMVSRYSYSHGYYDGFEREFRGFGKVEQWDTDNFAAMNDTGSTNADQLWHVPPVHTKTWFHTGFYMDGEVISKQLRSEYFEAQTARGSFFLDDTVFPSGLDGDQLREACRALKGNIIRTETYGEDGSDKAHIPYAIQESSFTIVPLQPSQDSHEHGIYFTHPRETLSIQYERNETDPRIQHELVLEVDEFGHVLKGLKAAYGRQPGKSSLAGMDKQKQETTLITYAQCDYTNGVMTEDNYVLPLPYQERHYQLSGLKPGPLGLLNFASLTSNGYSSILSLPEILFEAGESTQSPSRRLISKSRMLFRKDDLSSLLPPGQIQSLAVQGTAYEMAFTPGLVTEIFQVGANILIPNPRSVLSGVGPQQAGYVDLDGDNTWWKPSGTVRYTSDTSSTPSQELSFARSNFFQPGLFLDALGNSTSVVYDSYNLLPIKTTDAVGNTTTTSIDYRVLQYSMATSPNGNRSVAAFDGIGSLAGVAFMGKTTETYGDTLEGFKPDLSDQEVDQFFASPTMSLAMTLLGNATTRLVYDLGRYWKDSVGVSATPTYAAAITRETHSSDPTPAGGTQLQIKITYSDGFGRSIQVKSHTNPGPLTDSSPVVDNRWVASGWTIFNNKGMAVRKYENFFDDTHKFRYDMRIGVSPITMYDPLGRVIVTVRPDHAIEKIVIPNAWSQISFDVNDNVLLSNPSDDPEIGHYFDTLPKDEYLPSWYDARISGQLGALEKAAAQKSVAHANTPSTSHLDPIGRSILVIEDIRTDKFTTHMNLDIQGRQTSLVDPKGRTSMELVYSMDGDRLSQRTMDAGDEWVLTNATKQPLMKWNSRGYRFRYVYDGLQRQTETWFRDGNSAEILVEKVVYGEEAPDAATYNLRSQVWKTMDQAGIAIQSQFDFKGNILETSRQLAVEYKQIVDWSADVLLQEEVFTSTATFDAVNRTISTTASDQSVTYRFYNESQHLDRTFVNIIGENPPGSDPTSWSPMITGTQYNAKGQTTSISYGNGSTVTRTYDQNLFRLQNLRTVLSSNGGTAQNLHYTYDPIGNVTFLTDSAQQAIFFRNNRVDPSSEYTYDPVYRLISATGREHLGQTNGQSSAPTPSGPAGFTPRLDSPSDGNAVGSYTENYSYDAAGNILSINHIGSDPRNPGWTRLYRYNEPSLLDSSKRSDRLSATMVGSVVENYSYDGNAGLTGNITRMPHLSLMQWGYKDQLQATSKQIVSNGGVPETTYYVYDSKGQRVRKVTESQAGEAGSAAVIRIKERIYVQDSEIFRKYAPANGSISLERVTLHVASATGRIARIERRTVGTDQSPERLIRFQLTNLIGSASIEIDDQGRVISYEEYFPFGSTSYKAVATAFKFAAPKRYGFSGKELDEESGFHYFGVRYYASWLGRWTSADPVVQGTNLYGYVSSNPVRLIDPDGREEEDPATTPEDHSYAADKPSGSGPTPVHPTQTPSDNAPMGTAIHALVLRALQWRLRNDFPIPMRPIDSAVELKTPGGSKEGTGEPGKVDLAVLDESGGGLPVPNFTELKIDTGLQADYRTGAKEAKDYTAHSPNVINGKPVGPAIVGKALENAYNLDKSIGKDLFRPLRFDVGDFTFEIQIDFARDNNGAIIDGVILWRIAIYGDVTDLAVKIAVIRAYMRSLARQSRKIGKDDKGDRPPGGKVIPLFPAPKPKPVEEPGKIAARVATAAKVGAGVTAAAGVGYGISVSWPAITTFLAEWGWLGLAL